jgi:hypothetical protein
VIGLVIDAIWKSESGFIGVFASRSWKPTASRLTIFPLWATRVTVPAV